MSSRLLFVSRLLFIVICLALAGTIGINVITAADDADKPEERRYRYTEIPCWFAIPALAEVHCGELHTPEKDGGFVLPVVRIVDPTGERPADPVIYLQGGPGASVRMDAEGIQAWLHWRDYARMGRDLILIDPRGVGRSRPNLFCAAYEDFSLRVLKQNITLGEELRLGLDILRQCLASFAERGVPIASISTDKNAADIQALMHLLMESYPHYRSWNLIGVSYGSRLALLSAAKSPQVRSLILDSAYPPGYGGGQEWPAILDQALHRFADWCDVQARCRLANQQPLLSGLNEALQQLKNQPVILLIRRWDGEAPVNMVLNDHRFLSAVFSALYDSRDWPLIAPAIAAAIQGDRADLVPLIEPFINHALSRHFFGLAFMAVDCHDHPVQSEEDYKKRVEQFPVFAEYTRDLWGYQSCHLFPDGFGQQKLEQPLLQPTLLLAGGLDPITPLKWAADLHEYLPNSQLWIKEELGHAVIASDACIHRQLRRFLDAPAQDFSVGECQ